MDNLQFTTDSEYFIIKAVDNEDSTRSRSSPYRPPIRSGAVYVAKDLSSYLQVLAPGGYRNRIREMYKHSQRPAQISMKVTVTDGQFSNSEQIVLHFSPPHVEAVSAVEPPKQEETAAVTPPPYRSTPGHPNE